MRASITGERAIGRIYPYSSEWLLYDLTPAWFARGIILCTSFEYCPELDLFQGVAIDAAYVQRIAREMETCVR